MTKVSVYDAFGSGFDMSEPDGVAPPWYQLTLKNQVLIGGTDYYEYYRFPNPSYLLTARVDYGTATPTIEQMEMAYLGTPLVTISDLRMSAQDLLNDTDTKTFSGADTITGNRYRDVLKGYSGNDTLKGNGGNDALYAGSGRDTLVGGAGQDKLYGGTDISGDIFDFNSKRESIVGAGHDVAHNFSSGTDDIDLRGIDAHENWGANEAFRWVGKAPGTYSVWWQDTSAGVLVRGDVTGNRTPDFEILIAGVHSVSQSDFLL